VCTHVSLLQLTRPKRPDGHHAALSSPYTSARGQYAVDWRSWTTTTYFYFECSPARRSIKVISHQGPLGQTVRSQNAPTNCQDGVANGDAADRVRRIRHCTPRCRYARGYQCRHSRANTTLHVHKNITHTRQSTESHRACAERWPMRKREELRHCIPCMCSPSAALFTWTRADVNKHFHLGRQY